MHLLGSGYEPHVDEKDGKMIYSLPVESGFVTMDFSFEVGQREFEILKTDSFRYAVLYFSLHTLLQNTIGPSFANKDKPVSYTQKDFEGLAAEVLFTNEEDLHKFMRTFDKENNTSLSHFVGQFLNSKTIGKSSKELK